MKNLYLKYQKLVRDKDTAVNDFITRMLLKTNCMFKYDNLPVSIPASELERIVQTNGYCFVTDIDGKLYGLAGTLGGELDEYDRPTDITVANTGLNLFKTFKLTEGVLVKNDSFNTSLLNLIGKYGVLSTDTLITLNLASVLCRVTYLISAQDDKTKASADMFLNKILDGDFSVIGCNSFFEGVKLQTTNDTNTYIARLIELLQYYRAQLFNELGINSNWNMKRERLNLGEIEMNTDAIKPYVDNMFTCRVEAVKELNKRYNLNISVNYNSSWKLEHETVDEAIKVTELADGVNDNNDNNDTSNNSKTLENEKQTGTDASDETTETDGNETETDRNETETDETEENKRNEKETE